MKKFVIRTLFLMPLIITASILEGKEMSDIKTQKDVIENTKISERDAKGFRTILFPLMWYKSVNKEEILKYTGQKAANIANVGINIRVPVRKMTTDKDGGKDFPMEIIVTLFYPNNDVIKEINGKDRNRMIFRYIPLSQGGFGLYEISVNPMYLSMNEDSGAVFYLKTDGNREIIFHIPEFYLKAMREVLEVNNVFYI
jgi:hypothetical protein